MCANNARRQKFIFLHIQKKEVVRFEFFVGNNPLNVAIAPCIIVPGNISLES